VCRLWFVIFYLEGEDRISLTALSITKSEYIDENLNLKASPPNALQSANDAHLQASRIVTERRRDEFSLGWLSLDVSHFLTPGNALGVSVEFQSFAT
jgi:hypothetical protein